MIRGREERGGHTVNFLGTSLGGKQAEDASATAEIENDLALKVSAVGKAGMLIRPGPGEVGKHVLLLRELGVVAAGV